MATLDPGDTVLVEAPTYMMALHVFRGYEARIVAVDTDEEGLDPDRLEQTLGELAGAGVRPKLFYVIPSFQNPSGRTLSAERRRRVVELCRRFGVLIVEDHAYAELAFDGPPLASLKSLDPDNVVLIHTFSKIFGPGVRLGWTAASPELTERLGLCKLGTDQCANTLTQRLVYDYGTRGGIEDQIVRSIDIYREKRDRMARAMEASLPASARYERPGGGFFFWVRLAEGTDSERLLRRAIEEHQTAFVAGTPFYEDGRGAECLRLSFSFVNSDAIDEGIARLGRAIEEDAESS